MKNKKKIIALIISLFLFLIPFKIGFLDVEPENGILELFMMVIAIIGITVAIFMFNQETENQKL